MLKGQKQGKPQTEKKMAVFHFHLWFCTGGRNLAIEQAENRGRYESESRQKE